VLSAYGMLVADMNSDAAQSMLKPLPELLSDLSLLATTVAGLIRKARQTLRLDDARERIPGNLQAPRSPAPAAPLGEQVEAGLDLRYRGQSYELTVPLSLPITATAVETAALAFHAAHAQRYGYSMTGEPLEAVTLRVRVSVPGPQLTSAPRPQAGAEATAARLADRSVWLNAAGPQVTACYRRDRLQPGNRIDGPCLVLQYDSTLLLEPGWAAQVDGFGNLLCERKGSDG